MTHPDPRAPYCLYLTNADGDRAKTAIATSDSQRALIRAGAGYSAWVLTDVDGQVVCNCRPKAKGQS